MKKMLKIAFSLLMTLVLAAGMCVSSVAEDAAINLTYKGEAGGGFEFKPGSGYTSTDLFDNFKNVMPGDELEQKVTNDDTQHDYVNLYMRAVPHGEENAPQAQVSTAQSNEFLSKLEMWVYNGETEIYHASPNQPAQLASDVLLGSFFKGETATLTVKLKVPIELDNQYANRIGEVDCFFIADGKTCAAAADGKTYQLRMRLCEVEARLPAAFVKINRGAVGQLSRIERFIGTFAGGVDARFYGGHREYVSRRCLAEIKRRMHL